MGTGISAEKKKKKERNLSPVVEEKRSKLRRGSPVVQVGKEACLRDGGRGHRMPGMTAAQADLSEAGRGGWRVTEEPQVLVSSKCVSGNNHTSSQPS